MWMREEKQKKEEGRYVHTGSLHGGDDCSCGCVRKTKRKKMEGMFTLDASMVVMIALWGCFRKTE